MNSMYHDVLTKCRSVSRNQFIQAEKIAKEKMMASMFTHFISEEHKAPSTNEALTNSSQTGVNHTTTEFSFAPTSKPNNESRARSEEHTSELQSLMRISYAVSCLKKKSN